MTGNAPSSDPKNATAPAQQTVGVLLVGTILLFLILARPLFLGRVYTYDDFGAFALPIRQFYRNALIQGDSFLWSPSLFNGFYLHGEGQAGMCHPLHLLLYRLLPLEVAFNLEMLLSYAFLFPGVYLLLRHLNLPRTAALCGAFLFTFSSSTLLHSMHMNAIAITAHLPWLLLAIDVTLRTQDRRRLALAQFAISLLTGSQLLLGYPQYVWFSLLAEGAFLLIRWPHRVSTQRLVVVVAAKLLGILLGAVQLLPTLETLSSSVRHRPTLNFRLTGSLSPINLLQIWAPYIIHNRVYGMATEEGVYNGAFCTIAPIWLLMRRRSLGPGRSLAVSLAWFSGVMLLFALGRYGGVYWLAAQLPVLNLFRMPTRYLILLHLALAMLAAIAIADLIRMQQNGERLSWLSLRPLAIPFGLCAATLLAVVAARVMGRAELFAPLPYAVISLLLIGAASLLTALTARGAAWSLPLLAALTVLDMAAWGMRYPIAFPPQSIHAQAASFPAPPSAHPGERMAVPTALPDANALILAGYRLTGGYVALTPMQGIDFTNVNALRVAGATWSRRSGTWQPTPSPLPRVRLATRTRVASNDLTEIEQIDPAQMVLTDLPLNLPPGVPGTARLTSDRPGRIDLESEAPTSQLLILSESFHSGWQATLDDRPIPVLRVYRSFLGCRVAAGRHRVHFRFQPISFSRGLLISLGGLAVATIYFLFLFWKK